MDIFDFRDDLIGDYAEYVRSFVHIRDERIGAQVDEALDSGRLWPQPLLQLNPSFEPGGRLDTLATEGVLHPKTPDVFRVGKSAADPLGSPLDAHRHQVEALRVAHGGHPYVLTTGTGPQELGVHESNCRRRVAQGHQHGHPSNRGSADCRCLA